MAERILWINEIFPLARLVCPSKMLSHINLVGTATLYAYKIFGRKDLVQVQWSLAAQMHEEKLGVGAVSFLNEKVEGSR